ncbi:uncharacterized protein LOC123518793 [Portunus trituberculatus]|uniref:uncharacterized protein LOC123518793 n=1 Tax=Portunus trituberculatus TaxID=210409 RepID=UPI001E1CECE2|nr:uncharacterized protein LOC123518793 [Portunus trituberculatus]
MEVSCAPCPPGPTSLPLSSSAPDSVTTCATTTITTTTAAGKQKNTNLTEVSPDSGNGEDLDEFDPLKSPVKILATECEPEIQVLEAAVSGL